MSGKNIFYEEWRACLRAHFIYVLRERDTYTEQSLEKVLDETGFDKEEIEALRAEIFAELASEASKTEYQFADSPVEPEQVEQIEALPESITPEPIPESIPVMQETPPIEEPSYEEVEEQDPQPPAKGKQLSLF